jgi:phage gpG-like protein
MLNFEMDAAAISGKVDAMPAAVHEALIRKANVLRLSLEDKIKSQKLAGQGLNVRSGALQRSIVSGLADEGQDVHVFVRQSGEVKYGSIHEFGFDGQEGVKAHLRMIRTAFGRAINPKEVLVKAFTRHMNMPRRSFMQSALDDMKGEILDGLVEAVQGAVKSL